MRVLGTLQVLESGAREVGGGQGWQGRRPARLWYFLAVVWWALVRLVSGERALARPVLVPGKKERGSGCELT